ncbi:hypothetical protein [Endozoicomonas sp. ALB115]|uniref:hypothetical protein n=1 Tax=Endozoicomonas sp. ALB115 TaxID=3403074 RepID=UPI003BB75482
MKLKVVFASLLLAANAHSAQFLLGEENPITGKPVIINLETSDVQKERPDPEFSSRRIAGLFDEEAGIFRPIYRNRSRTVLSPTGS